MADNFTVLTSNGTTTATFRATDVGAGILAMMSIPTNLLGTAMVGQAVMATSISVAIASNQSNVPFNFVSFNGTTVTIGQQVITASLPVVLPSNLVVSTQLTNVGGTAVTLGAKPSTASIPVAIASDQLSPLGQATSAGSAPVVLPSDQTVSTNLAAVGAVAFSLGQKIMATSIPVAIASNQSAVPIGVTGYTSFPTAVANGAQVPLIGDKMGRGLVAGAARAWKASQTAVITTGAEITVVNPINATTFADIYGVLLANTGSTTCRVDFRHGTGSTVLFSVQSATGVTSGFTVPVDSAIPGSLSTANVSWTAQPSVTASINVSMFYVQAI